MYIVIESTPGYMPDSEPAEFDTYDEAIEYAERLGQELMEQGYPAPTCDHSGPEFIQWHTARDSRDLGRVIELTTVQS